MFGTALRNPARELSAVVVKIRLPAFAAEAPATAACTIPLGAGLVNGESTTIKVGAIDGGNRLIALPIICHLNEAEATSLAGVTIRNDIDTINSTVGLK